MKLLRSEKIQNCRSFRYWIADLLGSRFSITDPWIQNHIAYCPRCQKRLSGFNRVALSLSLLKSQPHKTDLLRRANQQALGVLQCSLRETPQAQKLKAIQPEPTRIDRLKIYTRPVGNAAACLAVLLLMRMGIFSSMQKFQTEGEDVMKQLYAKNLGEDLTNDIFTA
jgi:hypothetical protein